MKTELALLMLTDGRPSMTLEELAKLRNIDPRTAMNQIHARRFPIPVWKDGAGYFAHVDDVAKWLDAQREKATRDSQAALSTSSMSRRSHAELRIERKGRRADVDGMVSPNVSAAA
jgi:Pyocin activator protein PrtN